MTPMENEAIATQIAVLETRIGTLAEIAKHTADVVEQHTRSIISIESRQAGTGDTWKNVSMILGQLIAIAALILAFMRAR